MVMESDNIGHDMFHLVRDAQCRWLKPAEVLFILQNCEEQQFTHKLPQKPVGGSLFLFNRRVLKKFRKDGHSWRKRKDQKSLAEAHERLKVGNSEALNCYYAHGVENPNLQRRSYWMLDPAYDYIVLVHYREVGESRQETGSTSTYSIRNGRDETYELCNNEPNLGSVAFSSCQIQKNTGVSQFEMEEINHEVSSSSELALTEALRRLERDLSLNDDLVEETSTFGIETEAYGTQDGLGNPICQQTDYVVGQHYPTEFGIDIMPNSKVYSNVELQVPFEDASPMKNSVYPPQPHFYGATPVCDSPLLDEDMFCTSPANGISSSITTKQKFIIREISPNWCYTSGGAKIVIVGSFLSYPLEGPWACMFGDTEVPAQIIQDGVFYCHTPPHLHGNVDVYITSRDRECCSDVRKFEYHPEPGVHTNPETEAKSLDELLLLVKLVQMLKGDISVSRVVSDSKSDPSEESFTHTINSILTGTLTSSGTLEWIVEELLKDKLTLWLSSRSQPNDHEGCSLSKQGQGILHIVAGLGFVWALQPILNSGVGINFRDISGWTALHWAAKFGREKMVAALIASGASAGLVTDPNSQDPNGKTPASVAASCGHTGLAGYLSEVALTNHLSSLQLEETELSKALAVSQAERTVNILSNAGSSAYEDEGSLKHTLAAVRNAAQAAARIQAAFRAHSFRKRQQREAAALYAGGGGEVEYSILESNIGSFCAASKSGLRNTRENQLAALSIQKKYRGWKGRKDFIALRHKVIKIQAHLRGYAARKKFKVCWAVSILDKAILRWRRHGSGLRGFKIESGLAEESDDEDEDILKEFRKKKVDAAIDEAVSRVVAMFESLRARQQYHRIFKKYIQAKLELENTEADAASSIHIDDIASSLGISLV